MFLNNEIEKQEFHHRKNLIFLEDVHVYNKHVSTMVSSGEKTYKHFIGYKDDNGYKIKSLRIILPKKSAYVKSYDGENKWMNFLIKDAEFLKEYTDIWIKVSNSI